jgi:SAM-dependent methyltransferase
MSEPGVHYDHIGRKYDTYARTATLKRAEGHTILRMVGPLKDWRVLDLACGIGFYTRLRKQRGAAEVLGVDISPETGPGAVRGGLLAGFLGQLPGHQAGRPEVTRGVLPTGHFPAQFPGNRG